MSTRHRFPGNGYRNNVNPSRISSEASIQIHLSDSHNISRSFGRMHPTSSLPVPHQISQRRNLFIEAGRLAVDYLISHGVLHPNVLSTSSSNKTLKINNDLDFNRGPREVGGGLNSPTEGKTTTPTCSDNILCADDPSEKKRSPLHIKGKRRLLRPSVSTDLSDENGRDGTLPDKPSRSVDMIDDCNSVPPQKDAKEVDTNTASSINDGAHSKEYQDEKCFDFEKNPGPSSLGDITQSTDQLSPIQVALEKESKRSDLGEEDDGKNLSMHYCGMEASTARKDPNDLLTLCSSAELPSSKSKPADKQLLLMADGSDNNCQLGSVGQVLVPVQRNSTGGSSGSSDYEICGPMDKGRGKKRTLADEDERENPKKTKEWLRVSQNDEDLQLSDWESKHIGEQELMPSHGRVAIQAVNQGSATCISMLPKGGVGPSMAYSEEKQFLPSSFKICDLNLMDVCDTNENHEDAAIAYSSNPVPEKERSIDIDLSMNNSCSLNNLCNKYEAPNGGVEIIDLESGPLQGDKVFHNAARRMESDFTVLENFPSHLQNSSENPDVQDGFGFMLSPLVGTDMQNSPSGQPELNSMHNEIGVHHGEGILSDDDQIYMSLGEIPISLLRSWDQPSQDY